MTDNKTAIDFDNEPPVMPVLSNAIPDEQVSDALINGLDVLADQKAQFMDSADDLIQTLRPQMERMLIELVHRSLSLAWASKSKTSAD